MVRVAWTCVVVAALVGAVAVGARAAEPAAGGGKVRVGTYDPRAVAVAFAASAENAERMKGKMAEMKEAEGKKDAAKVAELKAWGAAQQRKLHRQGFGGAPVDDILAMVKDRLPEAARAAGVVVITRTVNYVAEGVEVVDVTDEVVKVFKPSEKTLRVIEDLKKKPVISEEALEAAEKKGNF